MQALVEKYIQLRDAKAKLAGIHKEKVATIDAVMKKIEAQLLADFTALGVDSCGTPSGTAYKSTQTSATVADWDACLDYIKANDLWNMLDKRVNKTAVVEFIEEHKNLPPGVNWREEIIINVRRS